MDNRTNQQNYNNYSQNMNVQTPNNATQNTNYVQNPSIVNNNYNQQVPNQAGVNNKQQNMYYNQQQRPTPQNMQQYYNQQTQPNAYYQNNQQQLQQPVQQVQVPVQPQQPVNAQPQNPSQANQTPASQPTGPKYEFNAEEKVIYQIKEEKGANPIGVFIILAIIIGVAFSLPTLSKKLGTIKNFNFLSVTSKKTETQTEEEEKETKYHFYDTIATAEIGNIAINQLGIGKHEDEYMMSFSIFNRSSEPYTFDKKYYINLYDDNETLQYRALLYSFDSLAANSSREMTLVVPERVYNRAKLFDLEEIEVGKYKSDRIEGSDGEYQILTCKYQNDEIKYYFKDNLLAKIYETYSESLADSTNYYTHKTTYENLSAQYRSMGLESHFEEKSEINSFLMITEFDYTTNIISDYTMDSLKQYKYFKYNTSSQIIAFEMPAIAYTCS